MKNKVRQLISGIIYKVASSQIIHKGGLKKLGLLKCRLFVAGSLIKKWRGGMGPQSSAVLLLSPP